MCIESPLSARPHANAGDIAVNKTGAHVLFEGFRVEEQTGAKMDSE